MLLEGSYQRDVEIILEQLRLVRRNMIREGALPVSHFVLFLSWMIYMTKIFNVCMVGERSYCSICTCCCNNPNVWAEVSSQLHQTYFPSRKFIPYSTVVDHQSIFRYYMLGYRSTHGESSPTPPSY